MTDDKKTTGIQSAGTDHSFEQLPFQKQLEQVARERGSKKINLIISSPQTLKLTRRLSEEDIYLTIKEVGELDALPLFELTNYRQAQYIYDLEWWDKGSLVPQKIVFWLSLMLDSNGMKFIEWVRNISLETLIAVFQQLIVVHRFDNIDELSGDIPELQYFTLDNVNFIEFIDPEHRAIISQALKTLRARLHDIYHELLEGMCFQLKFAMEEDASWWRQNRLVSKGFPEINEAMMIYQPMPQRFRHKDSLSDVQPAPVEAEIQSPTYALDIQKKALFLSKVLATGISPQLKDRIRFELAHLSHKILVADGLKPDYKTLQDVLKKAYSMVNIGLETLSASDLSRALTILDNNFMEHIFRIGYEPIASLRTQAQEIFKDMTESEKEFWINFLDLPFSDVIKSLRQSRPRFRVSDPENPILVEKEFETEADIERTREYVELGHFIVELFRNRFALQMEIPNLVDSPLARAMVADVNWTKLLNSMFIHFVTRNTITIMPLHPDQIPDFFDFCFQQQIKEKKSDGLALAQDLIDNFNQALEEHQKLLPGETGKMIKIQNQAFRKLVEQFEGITPTREILTDFRLFPDLWFQQEFEHQSEG
ncbi:DUF6178 family protein [candidate division CSSED10-310 bacterium]|uniref:DUF6178 family protein n=1 Tax=candidate division CSSED10-310 bacterium TaxID=2855610 RepID=A0ABV6YZB8_UNCC1